MLPFDLPRDNWYSDMQTCKNTPVPVCDESVPYRRWSDVNNASGEVPSTETINMCKDSAGILDGLVNTAGSLAYVTAFIMIMKDELKVCREQLNLISQDIRITQRPGFDQMLAQTHIASNTSLLLHEMWSVDQKTVGEPPTPPESSNALLEEEARADAELVSVLGSGSNVLPPVDADIDMPIAGDDPLHNVFDCRCQWFLGGASFAGGVRFLFADALVALAVEPSQLSVGGHGRVACVECQYVVGVAVGSPSPSWTTWARMLFSIWLSMRFTRTFTTLPRRS